MNIDFNEVMSKHADDELIKIVTIDKNKYQPLAIEAAEEEIKKRREEEEKKAALDKKNVSKKPAAKGKGNEAPLPDPADDPQII